MSQNHTLHLALIAAAGLFVLGASASGKEELGEELPPKARTVAVKFEIYQETATAEAVGEKRKQVIEYLRKLLKNEAADANLDGALAIKALIEQLETSAPQARSTARGSDAGQEGLLLEEFSINHEAKRRLEFPFRVARDRSAKSLRCEITGASDDTGDGGLEYELIDPRGKVVKEGALTSSELVRVSHRTHTGGEWKLILRDADTKFAGEHPGNNGSLRITVVRGQAALATNRRAR